jgi:hypothetical protein
LLKLGALADVVTLENEFVDAESLAQLEQSGHKLWPTAATMRVVQDKLRQKQTLAAAGLPVPRFYDAPTREAVMAAAANFGWPVLLKNGATVMTGKAMHRPRPEELGRRGRKWAATETRFTRRILSLYERAGRDDYPNAGRSRQSIRSWKQFSTNTSAISLKRQRRTRKNSPRA